MVEEVWTPFREEVGPGLRVSHLPFLMTSEQD